MEVDVILAIDADEICYEVACACEDRGVLVTNTTNSAIGTFKTRTKLKEFLSGLTIPEGHFTIEDTQVAEPLKNALSTIKSKIINLKEKFKTENVELYFSGSNNFRLALPLPEQYKANRKDNLRPLLLTEIKEYLIKYHKAIVVDGDEADQMIAQRMWDGYKSSKKIIGITRDKDAKSNMGWLYNPDKDELSFIDGFGKLEVDEKGKTRGYGRVWLYYQWMMGDWGTDHFCPRQIVKAVTGKSPTFGDKACFKLLSVAANDQQAVKIIYDKYVEWFGKEEFSYTDWEGKTFTGNYLDAMQMILDCARMKRFEKDEVKVTDILTKMGIDYDNQD